MDPNSPISALGEGTVAVREKMGGVFLEVVRVASDAPGGKLREVLHMSSGSEGALFARHEFAFCGVRFLTLHYDISCRD